jgi:hypothetical protein
MSRVPSPLTEWICHWLRFSSHHSASTSVPNRVCSRSRCLSASDYQVGLVLGALRVVAGPVGIHLARQRVVRRRGVHSDPGVTTWSARSPRPRRCGRRFRTQTPASAAASAALMPAMPAPMIATLVVSGIGAVRGSVGLGQLEAALLQQKWYLLVVDGSSPAPAAAPGRRIPDPRHGDRRRRGAAQPSALDHRGCHHCAAAVSGIGDPARSGRIGYVRDLGAEPVDHRRIAGQLRQHRRPGHRGPPDRRLARKFLGVRRRRSTRPQTLKRWSW